MVVGIDAEDVRVLAGHARRLTLRAIQIQIVWTLIGDFWELRSSVIHRAPASSRFKLWELAVPARVNRSALMLCTKSSSLDVQYT
jgi:hypothetical protein